MHSPLQSISDEGRLILEKVRSYPLEGFERSFKMSSNGIQWDRFLFAVETKRITMGNLLTICNEIGMPAEFCPYIRDYFNETNQVGFGFERITEKVHVYKVYLEFWEKIIKNLHLKTRKTDPELLHFGFKWDRNNPEIHYLSRYTTYPLLSEQGILERLELIYQGRAEPVSYQNLKKIVSRAMEKATNKAFVYMEVAEDGFPRNSYDVNLYKADMRLKDCYSLLNEVRESYGIPTEEFDVQFNTVRNKTLGHIAGGIDREGKDFFTVYYEDAVPDISLPRPVNDSGKRIGRNDPCFCGSGKKFKKCCGKR